MILECGQTFVRNDNEEILLMKLALYLQKCGVELMIIDEIQHIKRPELKRRVLEVSNMTRHIPIICASCRPIEWTEVIFTQFRRGVEYGGHPIALQTRRD